MPGSPAMVLIDVVQALPIVAQHVIGRAVLDDVADAFRAEQGVLLQMLAVQADIEIAQQREDHHHGAKQKDVQLGAEGQTQPQPATASWFSLLHAPSPLKRPAARGRAAVTSS